MRILTTKDRISSDMKSDFLSIIDKEKEINAHTIVRNGENTTSVFLTIEFFVYNQDIYFFTFYI